MLNRFLPPLFSVRMADMTPEVITKLIEDSKLTAQDTYGRTSFREELKVLKAIFNWYANERDFTFKNPVTNYHKKISDIRPSNKKRKILSPSEVVRFIDCLEEPFQTIAVIQLYLAARIGEIAGITKDNLDLDEGTITLDRVMTWVGGKVKAKEETKTADVSTYQMNSEMIARLRLLDSKRPKNCRFIFNKAGKPFRYNEIVEKYNEALQKAGIEGVTGTHILRYTMGTMTRKMAGLDAAQAILRHTTPRMSQHYAKLDVSEKASEVIIEAEEIFRKVRATNATTEEEKLKKTKT
jgi:integrase